MRATALLGLSLSRRWLDDRPAVARTAGSKVLQSDGTPLYLFTLAAEEIDLVADVARICRDEAGKLIGYQRPEKKKHVKQIQEYLDSERSVLFPNGLILALADGGEVQVQSRAGHQRRTRCRRDAGDPHGARRPMARGRPGSSTASSGASPWHDQEPPAAGAGRRLRRRRPRTAT